MNITTPMLRYVLPPSAAKHASNLSVAANRYDINTVNRLGCWLGQMHVESGGFTKVLEDLNYRTTTLLKLFSRSRISEADAKRYGSVPGQHRADTQAIATCLYGGEWGRKNLGNLLPGDGWRFIGRGFKQITGRYNYSVMSSKMFGDDRLLLHPGLLELPENAALSAGCFWDWKKLNPHADKLDHNALTKIINGGLTSYDERVKQSELYIARITSYLSTQKAG